jgi:hypothetical protein
MNSKKRRILVFLIAAMICFAVDHRCSWYLMPGGNAKNDNILDAALRNEKNGRGILSPSGKETTRHQEKGGEKYGYENYFKPCTMVIRILQMVLENLFALGLNSRTSSHHHWIWFRTRR